MKLLSLLLIASSVLFAHTGTHDSGGFLTGFLHPIGGLDHILAMIGVGMLAYFATNKGYLTLVSFIGAMILAASVGYAGVSLIGMEAGIMISIAVVFGMIGFAHKLPISALAIIVAFFGMFHGFAHGAEFTSGNFVAYMMGFASSTLILHLSGMALAYLYSKKLQLSLVK